jgi:hypothetical protein
MDPLMQLTLGVEILNSIVLLGLLYIFFQNFKALKSKVALGLIIFSGVLLLQNLTAITLHFMKLSVYTQETTLHAFILSLIQLIALIVLFWISWKE